MWGKLLVVLMAAVLAASPAQAARRKKAEPDAPPPPPFAAEVAYVKDGDTIVIKLNGGEQDVRLVDINTPEGPHNGAPAEPFADAARTRMRDLSLHHTVKLVPATKGRDKYNRLLADVYLPDGTWLNAEMVREGFAHVYTFADDAMHPAQLLALEQEARAAGRGIWGHPRWRVKDAATCCAPAYIGIFQVVEGTVQSTGQGQKVLYLNFGPDYHTDFTVVIEKKDLRNFKAAGIDPLAAYAGKKLRLHGFTDPIEGVEMRVTHPAQVEVLN